MTFYLYLQTIMIGDDVVSDVGGAQSCGLGGVLVRTGKYRYELPQTMLDKLVGSGRKDHP